MFTARRRTQLTPARDDPSAARAIVRAGKKPARKATKQLLFFFSEKCHFGYGRSGATAAL